VYEGKPSYRPVEAGSAWSADYRYLDRSRLRLDRAGDLRPSGLRGPTASQRVIQIAIDVTVITAVTIGVVLASAPWLLL
jgi:hypothetical protein